MSIRQAVTRLGQNLLEAGADTLPDLALVKAVLRLAWASGAGDLAASDPDTLKQIYKTNSRNKVAIGTDYAKLAREELEVLRYLSFRLDRVEVSTKYRESFHNIRQSLK